MGSDNLSNHVKYNVIPMGYNAWPDREDIRGMILEKLPIFLHGLKHRLTNPSIHFYWEDKSRFLVRDCEDLKVEKRFEFRYWMSPQQPGSKYDCPVSAEITTTNSRVTLWLKKADQADMYE